MCWDQEEVGSDACEAGFSTAVAGQTNWPVRVKVSRQKAKASLFHVFYVDCHKKAWPRVRMGLLTSNNQIKRNPLDMPAALVFT